MILVVAGIALQLLIVKSIGLIFCSNSLLGGLVLAMCLIMGFRFYGEYNLSGQKNLEAPKHEPQQLLQLDHLSNAIP